MAHCTGRREIGVQLTMRAASVDPKSTQLTPLTTTSLHPLIDIAWSADNAENSLPIVRQTMKKVESLSGWVTELGISLYSTSG